jgi:hypothetical protein
VGYDTANLIDADMRWDIGMEWIIIMSWMQVATL